MKQLAIILAAVFLAAAAPDPADSLPDATQEARARALFSGVRCVVCQNESIDDSEADLARDLRQTIRREIAAGRSDEEVNAFLIARYGDFILLRPRFTAGNAILWGAPFLIVLIGAGFLVFRRRAATSSDVLSPEELKALKALENVSQPNDPA